MKKCLKCKKDFEPIKVEHEFCPSCWDKVYKESHPEQFKTHRLCLDCKRNIDYQPDNFKFCPSCWRKRKNAKE